MRCRLVDEEVGQWHSDYAGDPQQGVECRVRCPGLDLLVVGPVHRDREIDPLLGEVVVLAGYLDAPADALPFAQHPCVIAVGGVGWHSTNALTAMIISQPGLTRLSVILKVARRMTRSRP